jgi:hypothetical protein
MDDTLKSEENLANFLNFHDSTYFERCDGFIDRVTDHQNPNDDSQPSPDLSTLFKVDAAAARVHTTHPETSEKS